MANEPKPTDNFLGAPLSQMPGYTESQTSGGGGGTSNPNPGDTREVPLPSGRIVLQTWGVTGTDEWGEPTYGWTNEGSYFGKGGADSGESAANAAANRRLQAMTSALGSFLQAQSLADARKMAASEQFQKMAAFAVPKGTTVMPGWEEGGPMQALAAVRGRPQFQARGVQTQHVNPAQLAEAGQVPAEVLAMINQVKGAG